jgi:hypothetical protein
VTPIEEIEARLRKYPAVRYGMSSDSLRLDAPNDGGFPLAIRRAPEGGWAITFGQGLHCHFIRGEDAVAFFIFGLSATCRLREIHRGRSVCRAFAERREDSGWRTVQESGLLLYPFWRRSSEYVFQNTLLSIEDPA